MRTNRAHYILLCIALTIGMTHGVAALAAPAAYTGDTKIIETKYEDTMVEIARANDIGFNELRSANPFVDPWIPGAGVEMVIPSRHILPESVREGVVINLPEMRIYLYDAKGNLKQTHPIGIGREGLATPIGTTTVVRKTVGPIWRPTPRMLREDPKLKPVVGPGPDNPMGTHALYLGWPTYAIHGTDKPYGIGRRASSGCIRLYPEDIVAVYPQVPIGTKVTVVNQPVKAAWIDGELFIEASPPLDQAMMIEENGGHPYYDLSDADMRHILKVAGKRAGSLDWGKIREVIRNRDGIPVAVAQDSSAPSAQREETRKTPKAVAKAEDVQNVVDADASVDETPGSARTETVARPEPKGEADEQPAAPAKRKSQAIPYNVNN